MHLVKDGQSIKFSSLGNGAAQGHHFLEDIPRGMYYTISYYITVYPTFRHTSGRGKTTGLASSLAASRCPAVLEILRSPLVALHAAGQARKHVLLQASSRFLQPRAAILGARLAVGQFWLGLEDVRSINGIRWYKHYQFETTSVYIYA